MRRETNAPAMGPKGGTAMHWLWDPPAYERRVHQLHRALAARYPGWRWDGTWPIAWPMRLPDTIEGAAPESDASFPGGLSRVCDSIPHILLSPTCASPVSLRARAAGVAGRGQPGRDCSGGAGFVGKPCGARRCRVYPVSRAETLVGQPGAYRLARTPGVYPGAGRQLGTGRFPHAVGHRSGRTSSHLGPLHLLVVVSTGGGGRSPVGASSPSEHPTKTPPNIPAAGAPSSRCEDARWS